MLTVYNQTNLLNDIDIVKLLVEHTSSYPVLQDLEKDVFGLEDKYHIFSDCLESPAEGSPTWDYENHWPGIMIVLPNECERPLAPCPFPNAAHWATGYYLDDYEPPWCPETTINILERFDVPVRLDGQLVNANWEPEEDGAIFESPTGWRNLGIYMDLVLYLWDFHRLVLLQEGAIGCVLRWTGR